MTYEEKSEIVIRQLREDRDRLLDAIDNIKAEIEQYNRRPSHYPCDTISVADVLQIIDKYKKRSEE